MTKVLLIDDDEAIHALLQAQIESADIKNIDLVSALSGNDGVKKYVAEGANIVIMDLKMADGDGVSATKQIIRHDPDAKIFIMTAYPSSNQTTMSLDAGALGIVKKAGQFAALILAFVIAISQNGGVID